MANTQTTLLNRPGNDLTPEMKTYYEKRLIDLAEPKLVHDQFGDKYPIPKNGGKSIEFRKYSPLGKAMTPITEGVTPDGNSLNVTTITADVDQYGDWIQLSDVLQMTAIDNNVVQATRLLGAQAGRTLDTITREVLNGGLQVLYAPEVEGDTVTPVTSRAGLTENCKLTVDAIYKAAAELKAMLAEPIDDAYVAIIHPYVAYDLMRHPEWIEAHKYAEPENLYQGEIGKIGGVRFVETTEAKIFAPEPIAGATKAFTVKTAVSSSTTEIAVNEAISAADVAAFPEEGVAVYVNGAENRVTQLTAGAAGAASITLETAVTTLAAQAKIVGQGGTAEGRSVFSTLVLGKSAFGVTDIEGGGLTHIVKQLGYGDDPLNQRSSCGWKAMKVAERLVEEYMLRIESCSTYDAGAN